VRAVQEGLTGHLIGRLALGGEADGAGVGGRGCAVPGQVVELPDGTDTIAVRTMGYLALSFDHRLVDGAEADAFMGVVKATLESGTFPELD